jgi:hypothetical protein
MPTNDLLVTPSEAVQVLRGLEPRAVAALENGEKGVMHLTPARVRYLENYGVVPIVRGSGIKGLGGSRLYGVTDLAMLRLWVRMSAVMPVASRFTFVYLGDQIRKAVAQHRALVLVVRGKRAELLTTREAAAIEAPVVIPLLDVLGGVTEAVVRVRTERPELWAGREWLTPAEAMQELVAV